MVYLAVYAVINVVVFMMYAWDKHKAQADKWRTKESTLIIGGLFGPFGAVGAMQVVRHKTQKPKFKLNYVFLVIHIIAIAYLVSRGFF